MHWCYLHLKTWFWKHFWRAKSSYCLDGWWANWIVLKDSHILELLSNSNTYCNWVCAWTEKILFPKLQSNRMCPNDQKYSNITDHVKMTKHELDISTETEYITITYCQNETSNDKKSGRAWNSAQQGKTYVWCQILEKNSFLRNLYRVTNFYF